MLLATIWLMLSAPAMAQDDTSVTRLTRSIKGQEQLNADLRAGMPRMQQETAGEGERLSAEEANVDGTDLSINALRQARFEADTRRTRLAATDSRVSYFRDELAKIDTQIAQLTPLAPATPTTLEE